MNISRGFAFAYGAVAFAVVLIAGCSGGGGTSVSPSAPGSTPAPGPSSTALKQSATAILTFPRGTPPPGTKRYYVSPNSTSVSVTIVSVNGSPPPNWVPPQVIIPLAFSGPGQNCNTSGGVATCSVTIPAPPGNVIYSIGTYAVVNPPSPAPTATAPTILDYVQQGIQISEGKQNNIAITLQGVVKTATLSIPTPLVPDTTTIETMVLSAFDASGALITGTKPFDSPFKVTDGDPTALAKGTGLIVNGLPEAKSIQVLSPVDVVQIEYMGLAIGQQTISVSGNGKAGPISGKSLFAPNLYPIVIPGSFVDDLAHGGQPSDPNYNQNTLLVPVGTSATEAIGERGRTNPPYSNGSCNLKAKNTTTCIALLDLPQIYKPCTNSGIASFTPGPPGQQTGYTYVIKGIAPGLCLEQFFDGLQPQHASPPLGNPLVNGEIWVQVK